VATFSLTHIMFVLSLSIVLVFVSIHHFLCKSMVPKVINQMVVQITQLFDFCVNTSFSL